MKKCASHVLDEVRVLNSNLVGVEVVGEITLTAINQKLFKFRLPIRKKLFNSLTYRSQILSLGRTVRELLLLINGLSENDLPLCRMCGINRVAFNGGNRINLINPYFTTHCNKKQCGLKDAHWTRVDRGNNVQVLLTPEARSAATSKAHKTKMKNGTHISQTHGNYRILSRLGEELHFKSLAEVRVFQRYERFLTKYYNREKYISSYDNKSYAADYVLKVPNTKLPDVIEVKGGSLFFCRFSGDSARLRNYKKAKSVLELGKSVLFINNYLIGRTTSKSLFYLIKTITELDELFYPS